MKEIIKGRLMYLGWPHLPWKIKREGGREIDLFSIAEKFFFSLHGHRAAHQLEKESYLLKKDARSDFQFDYVPGKSLLLTNMKEFGGANVHAYMDDALIWLSGRMVEVKVDEHLFKISADPKEKVFRLSHNDWWNSFSVPRGAEKEICKAGERDCCVFLTGGSEGFFCEKFNSPIARVLLGRLAKGHIHARCIGSCGR